MTENRDPQLAGAAFGKLFQGFAYAHGTDSGGCRWVTVDTLKFERHLTGEEMIGTYPMVYDPHRQAGGPAGFIEASVLDQTKPVYPDMSEDLWHCKWGAIDIDEGEDALTIARSAENLFQALDIVSWVELSRSKGCHLWIFNQDWVPAKVMRQAMQAVMQMVGANYDAVYPKQDYLDGPPGNYMRLPYGGSRPEGRQEVIVDGLHLDVFDFIILAEKHRTPTDLLERAAELYQHPVAETKNYLPPARDYSKAPLMRLDGSRLKGLPLTMFSNGPVAYYMQEGAGRGRHGFLNRFARAMFETGFERTDVISWTTDLDSKLSQWWPEDGPKFIGRADSDRQIQRLVDNAAKLAAI
tara:strand:- start:935 stop:1993 length:1059 start_codon:yes stop_codon:yes gene_type:complete